MSRLLENTSNSLRMSVARMATRCSAPMDLWQDHSTLVLQAADGIDQMIECEKLFLRELERLREELRKRATDLSGPEIDHLLYSQKAREATE